MTQQKVESAISHILGKIKLTLTKEQEGALREFGLACLSDDIKFPFMYGNPGSGKTTIAMLMARAGTLLDMKSKVITAVELTLAAQKDTQKIVEIGNHEGLLIIDDIGISGWSVKSYGTDIPVMDYTLLLRYSMFLRGYGTIITSNIPFDRIGDYLSEQVTDRCNQMFKPIPMIRKSLRVK